jgi:hypothetical protein
VHRVALLAPVGQNLAKGQGLACELVVPAGQ